MANLLKNGRNATKKNQEEEAENPLVFVFFANFSERFKTNHPI
jgi:hypothetical protein